MRLLDWRIIFVGLTTSPTRWSVFTMAVRARASSVQDFRTDVQSLARTRATIPWSAQPRCRPAWPVSSRSTRQQWASRHCCLDPREFPWRRWRTGPLAIPALFSVLALGAGWNCRGLGLNPQFMFTDAHFWVKIGFKFQSLGKISNIRHLTPLFFRPFPTLHWGVLHSRTKNQGTRSFGPRPRRDRDRDVASYRYVGRDVSRLLKAVSTTNRDLQRSIEVVTMPNTLYMCAFCGLVNAVVFLYCCSTIPTAAEWTLKMHPCFATNDVILLRNLHLCWLLSQRHGEYK